MKSVLRIIHSTVVASLFLGVAYSGVTAQTSNQSASHSASTANSLVEYRAQIDAYRTAERSFEVSKQQYLNLQTLAALETAVTATRTVLLARTQVLLSYFELLSNNLQNTQGINLDLKTQTLQAIEAQIVSLRSYQDQLLLATDRDSLLTVTTLFVEMRPEIESTAYKTLSLIAVGKVQTVNDKAEALLDDIIQTHTAESVSSLTTQRRERAYTEIEKTIETTNESITEIVAEKITKTRLFTASTYTQLTDDLNESYVLAQKTLGFLQELLKS